MCGIVPEERRGRICALPSAALECSYYCAASMSAQDIRRICADSGARNADSLRTVESYAGATGIKDGDSRRRPQQRIDASLADLGPGLSTTVWQWKGLQVNKIEFEGVTFDATDKLPSELTQKVGEPFDPQKVRQSTRRLFASGRYRDIEVRGIRQGNGVTLIFAGSPRFYVGRVTIAGVKSERLTSLLEYATKLTPGTALTRVGRAGWNRGDQRDAGAAGLLPAEDLREDGDRYSGRSGQCDLYRGRRTAGADWAGAVEGHGPGYDAGGVQEKRKVEDREER